MVVVCGNRTDTGGTGGRQVSEADGRSWAERHNFSHVVTSAALGNGVIQAFNCLFVQALQLKEGVRQPGAPPPPIIDPDVIQAIHRLTHAKDDFDRMGINRRGATKDEINKAYRKLAGMVHPDKCKATGAEDAFKSLTAARGNLLKLVS